MEVRMKAGPCFFGEQGHEAGVEHVGSVVVELRGDSAIDRHAVHAFFKKRMCPLVLFAHVAQGIHGSSFIKLIDGDDVGEVNHVNLFQLRGGAEFRRHHVKRHIGVVHDFGVGLPDAGAFEHDEVEGGSP